MSRWIRRWLRAWRSQPLELVSPVPIQLVRARLIAGRTSYLRAFVMFGGRGGHLVLGRVGRRRISLVVAKLGVRSVWLPGVHGKLEPTGTGGRLVGTIGLAPVVKAFCVLSIAGPGCAFLGLLAVAVAGAARGDATRGDFLACLFPLGMMTYATAPTAWGLSTDRGEAAYLTTWLNDRLQTPETGIRGYRSWQGNPTR